MTISHQGLLAMSLILLVVLAGCQTPSNPFSRLDQTASPNAMEPDQTARQTEAATVPPDPDQDGLASEREHEIGTDPTDADSDDDGLRDGTEYNDLGTDPTAADTDGDGLDDKREVQGPTAPTSADTDTDGLDDQHEVSGPTDATNPDTDADGLEDGDEDRRGTDPTEADTDADGLNDKQEVSGQTDPKRADTDGDGLEDGDERTLETDPVDRDTDKDGIEDGVEADSSQADPLRRDIFIEIDRTEADTHWFPDWERERIITTFENAPIRNPDGTTGVDVHLFEDEVVPTPATGFNESMLGTYTCRYKDSGPHVYYALLVHDLDRDLRGVAYSRHHAFLLDEEAGFVRWLLGDNEAGSVFVHELGHLLGLHHSTFAGIDSTDYDFNTYSSVMNYNAPADYYDYSRGTPFSGWDYLQQRGFPNPPAQTC